MKKFILFSFFTLYLNFHIPQVSAVYLGGQYGFGNINSVGEGFSRLVTPGFAIATTIVAFSLIFGGFKYLTSGGDKEQVESAKNLITHAIIGFILLIFMFLVLKFLPEYFGLEGFKIIQ